MYIYIDIFKNVLMNVFNKYVHKIYIYINELTRPEIQCITLFSRSALISQLYLEQDRNYLRNVFLLCLYEKTLFRICTTGAEFSFTATISARC